MANRGATVVIVGGGVTGLSTAWWLARQGTDVVVLDKGIIGWEASGRNGGGCSHHHSPLFLEEQRLWPQMDELLGYPTEWQSTRIRIALTEDQLETYQQARRNAEHYGFRAEQLDPQQVCELIPLVGECAGGLFFHFGGHANPQRTVQAYAWALQDLGGRILQHTPVTGIRTAGGRAVAVETKDGEIGCDTLVIAAGPQTGELAAMVGTHVPLGVARAEMIVTEPLPLMKMGGADGNGLYGRQTLRGNLAYGGGPHDWLEGSGIGQRPGSTPLTRNLSRRLVELFPKAAHVRVIRSWAGLIENTPDGRPVIDCLRSPDNVVVATMSSVGFGLSPASGRAIADLVLHGRCTFADLSVLALSRFEGYGPDWREKTHWLADAGADTAA